MVDCRNATLLLEKGAELTVSHCCVLKQHVKQLVQQSLQLSVQYGRTTIAFPPFGGGQKVRIWTVYCGQRHDVGFPRISAVQTRLVAGKPYGKSYVGVNYNITFVLALRERERETETETETERHRERQRERDRDRDRERHRHRQTDRQTDRDSK